MRERVDEDVAPEWPSAARPAARCWKSAVSVATPKTPPIIRIIESTPDAAPALVRSTEPITAAVIGDIVMPIPTPPTMNAGRSVR